MSQWDEPVYNAKLALVHKERLFVIDASDYRVKVYRVSDGYVRPTSLWTTPGKGQGPGQIPDSANLVHITVDPANGDLWLSHYGGLLVFDMLGKIKQQIRLRFTQNHNRSWIHINGDRLAMGPLHPLKDRVYLRVFTKPSLEERYLTAEHKRFQVDNPNGLPMLAEGRYLVTQPELYGFGDGFLVWDPALGEFVRIDDSGQIQTLTHLPMVHYQPDLQPQRFDGEAPDRGRYRTGGYSDFQAGVVFDGTYFWTTLFQLGTPKAKRVLVKLSGQGEMLEKWGHPLITNSQRFTQVYLFHYDGSFLFLDLAEGDTLYQIPAEALKPIELRR